MYSRCNFKSSFDTGTSRFSPPLLTCISTFMMFPFPIHCWCCCSSSSGQMHEASSYSAMCAELRESIVLHILVKPVESMGKREWTFLPNHDIFRAFSAFTFRVPSPNPCKASSSGLRFDAVAHCLYTTALVWVNLMKLKCTAVAQTYNSYLTMTCFVKVWPNEKGGFQRLGGLRQRNRSANVVLERVWDRSTRYASKHVSLIVRNSNLRTMRNG